MAKKKKEAKEAADRERPSKNDIRLLGSGGGNSAVSASATSFES